MAIVEGSVIQQPRASRLDTLARRQRTCFPQRRDEARGDQQPRTAPLKSARRVPASVLQVSLSVRLQWRMGCVQSLGGDLLLFLSQVSFSGKDQEHRDGQTSLSCAETSLQHARFVLVGIHTAMNQGPRSSALCSRVVAARRSLTDETFQRRTYRNLCCTT